MREGGGLGVYALHPVEACVSSQQSCHSIIVAPTPLRAHRYRSSGPSRVPSTMASRRFNLGDRLLRNVSWRGSCGARDLGSGSMVGLFRPMCNDCRRSLYPLPLSRLLRVCAHS